MMGVTILSLLCVLVAPLAIQADTIGCPSTLVRDKYLLGYGNSCYEFIFNHPGDWEHAENTCKSHGGHLVSIDSPSEQSFISNNLQVLGFHDDKGIWIGFNDRNDEGSWRWSSGTPVKYKNWASGQPGILGFSEDCALMEVKDGGKWHDYPCHGFLFSIQSHGWVCEYGRTVVTKLPATSAPPTMPTSSIAPAVETRRPDPTTVTTAAPAVETRRPDPTTAATTAPAVVTRRPDPTTVTTAAPAVETRRPDPTTTTDSDTTTVDMDMTSTMK